MIALNAVFKAIWISEVEGKNAAAKYKVLSRE
jgi:hypothetical protein